MASVVIVYESGLIRAIQTDGRNFTFKQAQKIEIAALGLVGKRSLNLMRSHRVDQNRNRGQFQTGYSVSAGGPNAPYWRYHYYGTRPYASPPGLVMGPLPPNPAGPSPRFIRSRRGQVGNPWLEDAAKAVL